MSPWRLSSWKLDTSRILLLYIVLVTIMYMYIYGGNVWQDGEQQRGSAAPHETRQVPASLARKLRPLAQVRLLW